MATRLTNLPKLTAFQFNITTGGTPEKLTAKLIGTTIAFNSNGFNAADTITDSGSGFLIAGFRAGDIITVTGAVNSGNNGTFTIQTVTAGVMSLSRLDAVLTTEAAGNSVKIVAPKPVPEGVEVTVKAKYANASNIRVAGSSEGAASSSGCFSLRNNESLGIQVTSTDVIWLDGASGEGVEVIFESNKKQGE